MSLRLALFTYSILIGLFVANGCHVRSAEHKTNDSLKYYYHMEGPYSNWTTYTKEQRDSIMFKKGKPVMDDTTNHVGDIRYHDSLYMADSIALVGEDSVRVIPDRRKRHIKKVLTEHMVNY